MSGLFFAQASQRLTRGSAGRKVPAIGSWFWIIKILTTAMGEVTSDYLVHQLQPALAVALGALALAAAVAVQFRTRRYIASVYWLAVAMVAVFGTMVADVIHVGLGVPYLVSTTGFAFALAVILMAWYRVEGTLSIHTIDTRRREAFYWATVMASFALGTAAGDMTASTLHFGYLGSGFLFTLLIFVPAVAYRWLGINAIAAFWFAYVVTRPLGATFADWLGRAPSLSGLGFGTGAVSLALTIVIVVLVAYLSATHRDVERDW